MTKILIVEDDLLVSRMYRQAFETEGFQVDVAADGAEGVEKAKVWLPDVVMLDIMMPKMNGMQVLDSLKADPATKAIPVVMLTNLAGTQDMQMAKNKGAGKYMVKSQYKPREVVSEIKNMVASKDPKQTA